MKSDTLPPTRCKQLYRYDKWQLFKCFSSFPQTSSLARPAPPCTTPTGSGRGGHPDHTWQAVQHWESIQDEKSGIKVLYFNHLLHFLHSAVCPLSTDPKDSRINHTRLSLYNAERIQPRTGHGTGPPPSRPENGHLSKALLIKTASKPPTPWRWCVYWNTISQKCHCFQVLKNLIN